MLLEIGKTALAFRCPDCGSEVLASLDRLTAGGEMLRVNCPCKKSSLQIEKTSEGKLRLGVPCLICGKSHGYTVSSSALFGLEELTLACPFSGIPIFFAGKEDKVSSRLNESREELEKIAEKLRESHRPEKEEEYPCEIRTPEAVSFLIRELLADGKLRCGCRENEEKEIDFELHGPRLRIFCARCGKEKNFFLPGSVATQDFLDLDGIELE